MSRSTSWLGSDDQREASRRGALALHAKPDVVCATCGRTFKAGGIGNHRRRCDPNWTMGPSATRYRARFGDPEAITKMHADRVARAAARLARIQADATTAAEAAAAHVTITDVPTSTNGERREQRTG